MGVAVTLPELSEWTLLDPVVILKKNCPRVFAASMQVISSMTSQQERCLTPVKIRSQF